MNARTNGTHVVCIFAIALEIRRMSYTYIVLCIVNATSGRGIHTPLLRWRWCCVTSNGFSETMSQEMDWIGLYCFPCNMMKFGLCVCASVLLILSPVSQFGREVKKCLLRIWSKRKRKWKFRTKNTTSQCCDIDKTLYVVNLEKINYQCDCPVTVLFYSICDISKFARKQAAFFVSTSSESLSKLRILT